ncbi:MAG: ATP-binding protein [Pyrinomonadaceae bacterium]
MKFPFANTLLRYSTTIALVIFFTAIQWLLHPLLKGNGQLLFYILAIILAALVGRFMCGVVATIVSVLVGTYFFIEPRNSLKFDDLSIFSFILTFTIVGIIVSWLVEQLHLSRAHAEAKAAEAEREAMESRIAEEYYRESEMRFRNVADAAPVMIWVADITKKCVWFNQPWLRFTGRTMEQELANTREDAIHPDDIENCTDIYFSAFDARKPYSMEYRLRQRDGNYRWILDNGVPRLAPNGEFLGFIGSCIDIDDRLQVEHEREKLLEEARQAHAQAEVANRLKDEFIGTVSHELRTPLNAILGWTQMMHGGLIGSEQIGKAIQVIERNARSQAQLIEDLLDITRITSGKLRLNVRPTNLAQVVEAAVDTIRPAAEAKEITIIKILDTSAGLVSGDADRLQQVVWNLLSNAIKFSPKNGRIETRLEKIGSFIEIIVRDSGKGIESEFLPFVFDRFRQQDGATTRKYGGLGLGLAIVRNIVELHGGTVRADSEGENKGAIFTVRLPLRAITEIKKSPSGDVDERIIPAVGFNNVPDLSVDLQGLKILVVDDEPDARDLLCSLLTVYGADVTQCGSAAEALNMIPTLRPQILVSDIGMPQMDGYALIKKVRELSAEAGGQVPAIALTAYTRVEDRIRALSLGFQMFVPKPVEPSELVAAIKSLSGLNESIMQTNGDGERSSSKQ